MVKRAVRDLRSKNSPPPKGFSVIVDGDDITIELKPIRQKLMTLDWKDVLMQINMAVEEEKRRT